MRPDGLRSRTGSQSTPSGSPILSRTGRGAGSSDGAARLPVAERECQTVRSASDRAEHTVKQGASVASSRLSLAGCQYQADVAQTGPTFLRMPLLQREGQYRAHREHMWCH